MIELLDQTGFTVRLHKRPDRIVSVVPSQTELLSALGLDDRIAGITKFCIHPDHIFRNKLRVGGTKTLNIQKILELKPDLVIANREENLRDQIEALREKLPVYVSDINDLDASLQMISHVGEITGTSERANEMISTIAFRFGKLNEAIKDQKKIRCMYLIWKSPWMAAGQGTFINDLLMRSGFENVVQDSRYPELTDEQIAALNPDVVFLSSEPFPFKEAHKNELLKQTGLFKAELVDGEVFSWYGSRLLIAPEYLAALRHSLV